jgi:hypothetical protein
VIGAAAVLLGGAIRWLARFLKPRAESRILLFAPVVGLLVGLLAFIYTEVTGKPFADVLFSGQSALPSLLTNSAEYSVGALTMIVLCKGLAYALSMSSFRGGPIFPAMFVGAAGGLAMSHLPGLPAVAGAAMGIGAMTCVMLGLPLTSVLLTTLFMGSDGLDVMPVVIIAVVVAYVGHAYFAPTPAAADSGQSAESAPKPSPGGDNVQSVTSEPGAS